MVKTRPTDKQPDGVFIIERMEKEGVISQANHAGKREILVGNEQY